MTTLLLRADRKTAIEKEKHPVWPVRMTFLMKIIRNIIIKIKAYLDTVAKWLRLWIGEFFTCFCGFSPLSPINLKHNRLILKLGPNQNCPLVPTGHPS